MKKAFTMIELIFVIVITGILASVAISRLAATRDDTQIVYVLTQTRTLINDISNFYTARGEGDYASAKSEEITNIPISLYDDCHTIGSGSRTFRGSTLYLCVDGESILKIGTGNTGTIQKFILTADKINSPMGKLLQMNNLFQDFTNGINSKDYILNTTDVNF